MEEKMEGYMSNVAKEIEKGMENQDIKEYISNAAKDIEEKIEHLSQQSRNNGDVPNAANKMSGENAMYYMVIIGLLAMTIILLIGLIALVFYSLKKNNRGYMTLVLNAAER